MEPQHPDWRRPVQPTEEISTLAKTVDLDSEVKKAMANRTDLASARLQLEKTDLELAYRRNQTKYSLDLDATYILAGVTGDAAATFDGDNVEGIADSLKFIPELEFPTWRATVTLGIPIGNRSAEAQYGSSRLRREQATIAYQNFEQLTQVEVGVAVRRVQTDQKRIDAAEKNRILQEKKVEAEQKKFENGMSTSFQVLEFQKDLAEARSAEHRAKADYRISLSNLDRVTGVLDQSRNVKIDEYKRN
jgi:outer membrane protein TolC